MLPDIMIDHEEDIGGTDDLLRTSIAVDPDRVKPLSALESSTSGGFSLVEPGDGLGAQLWLESGERLARPTAGSTGRDTPPTLAGMVLSGPRQSREEAPHAGGGKLLCAVVEVGVGLVARRAAGTSPGAGCDDLGTTLHGVVRECAGAWLCHPGGVESLSL